MLFIFMASAPGSAAAAAALVVDLKDEAVVEADVVRLKDIADLRGTDSGLCAKVALLNIGRAPAFGEVAILSRQQVVEAIQKAFGLIPDGMVTGSQAIQIRLKGRHVSPAEIVGILRSYLSTNTPWKDAEVEIRSIGSLKGIEIPASDSELRLSTNATITSPKRILAQIEVLQAGKYLRSFWIPAEVHVRADVVTAARQIFPGSMLSKEDVIKRRTEITDLRASYACNLEDVIGKISRRGFSLGDPLTRESFSDPFLVRNGEMVRIRLERDGIVLTALAKAEQDGRLGQIIRVRNVDFSKTLKAQVTGRAEVQMQ